MRLKIAFALLGLAACSKEPEVKLKDATPEQVAKAVEKSEAARGETRFEPGQWAMESEVVDVAVQGLPPELATHMRKSQSKQGDSQCLTPEQAARPSSAMFAGRQGGSCKYESFEMTGGKIAAIMQCPDREGAKVSMTMNGDYSRTAWTVDAKMKMESPTSAQSMIVSVRSSGKRIGECRAGG